jgi:predicted helicase
VLDDRQAVFAIRENYPKVAMFSLDPVQCVLLQRLEAGHFVDNVTDWALTQFWKRYEKGLRNHKIDKEAVFHYVYGVLHDPKYRGKYGQDLKRGLPRVPFYQEFWRWAKLGSELMVLHIDYETADPTPLRRVDISDVAARSAGLRPRCLLRAVKEDNCILIDSETTLSQVPADAWRYKLGNRSAFEWVLDQYREWKPADAVIRAKFDSYHFAEHKELVIDLLRRVTTVSVETMRIIREMDSKL